MINPTKNPNAAVAVEGTSLAAGIIYVLSLVGVAVPAGIAILAAGGMTVGLLWIGKKGLRAVPKRLWYGSEYEAKTAKNDETWEG